MSGAKKPKLTPYVPPTPAERRAEFLRRLPQGPIATDEEALEVARAFDTEALHEQLDNYRGGRKTGEDREAAARIREHVIALRAKHPDATAKELYDLADKSIVPAKVGRGWDNLVSEVAPRRTRKRRAR